MKDFDSPKSGMLGVLLPAKVVSILKPNDKTSDGIVNKTFRLKVRVYGIHDDLSDSDLPYAIIIRPIFRGASSNVGEFLIPRVGSEVMCFFDGGDSRSIFIMGEALTGAVLISDFSESSIYGYEDEHGNVYSVDSSGNVTKKNVGNITSTIGGEVTITANKDVNVTVGQKVTVTVGGSTHIIIDGSSVTITTSKVKIVGDLEVDGTIMSTGSIKSNSDVIDSHNSLSSLRNVYNSHTHPYTDNGNPMTTSSTTTTN